MEISLFKKLAYSLVKGGADDALFGYDGGDKLIIRHVERGVIDLDIIGRHALGVPHFGDLTR